MKLRFRKGWAGLWLAALMAGCAAPAAVVPPTATFVPEPTATLVPTPDYDATPLPAREPFGVGTLLPYTTQTGDTLLALAAHFNTTPEEILAKNPGLSSTSTLASGISVTVPAYWAPLSGSAYKIIPDSELVYGPSGVGFDIDAYVAAQPGYLKQIGSFVAGRQRSAAQAVLYVAEQYSINPRLLLALMDWRTGALTNADAPQTVRDSPFGALPGVHDFYGQLRYVAEELSVGYYGWRNGTLTTLLLPDSTTSRPDFYQTAGTVAVQYLFSRFMNLDEFNQAISPQGFGAAYIRLFGNPFDGGAQDVIPGNLTQPELGLPFDVKQTWTLTGGPHPIWGDFTPWAALDLAPAGAVNCASTEKFAAAVADGVVVRSSDNTVLLDLDGDGDEQTGWVIFYLHVAERDHIAAGTVVKAGDPIGHPSCEGGVATGTHVHIGRKYNGEWIPADGIIPGVVPFVLAGWTAVRGPVAYTGRLIRTGVWAEACTCSTAHNTIYWVPAAP
ncbi:MAG: LysM peptidoglycan-binding domain-containing protein [Anaerolineales bacterium]